MQLTVGKSYEIECNTIFEVKVVSVVITTRMNI